MDALAAAAALAALAAGVLVHARIWPYTRCRSCQDRRGRGWGSTSEAWNRCRRCGGSGERIRPLSRIYPKWRAEARRRRK